MELASASLVLTVRTVDFLVFEQLLFIVVSLRLLDFQ
jgi:hypothetical protein